MRTLRFARLVALLVTLALACGLGQPALAADSELKPINTVCPVTGQPVDPTLAPVVVVLGKGDKAKRIIIGIADRSAAAQIKTDPQRFAEAAKANRAAK
jgi:hypothetical protein